MSCSIEKGVYLDNNGNKSKLYDNLKKAVGEDFAHRLFLLSKTKGFKDYLVNKKESVSKIVRYYNSLFLDDSPLNNKEIENIKTAGYQFNDSNELALKLKSIFIKDGIFSFNKERMRSFYNESEIKDILNNKELQDDIRSNYYKLVNTPTFELPVITNETNIKYTFTKNPLGSFGREISLEDNYNKSNVLNINDKGEILETTFIIPNAVKLNTDLDLIKKVESIKKSTNDTTVLEKEVKKAVLELGVDISNLNKGDYNALANFLKNPTEENTKKLEDALGFVRAEKITKEFIPSREGVFVKLLTTKTEEDVFKELGLLKTNLKNIYQKVNKIDIEDMRSILGVTDMTIKEHELYKKYYGLKSEIEIVNTPTNITTPLDYIKGDFLADFNIAKLKKEKEVYSMFYIDESGINLYNDSNESIETIKSLLDKNNKLDKAIIDYSELTLNLPSLKGEDNNTLPNISKQTNRDFALNNKHLLEKVISFEILSQDHIYAPYNNEEHILVGDSVFESEGGNYYSVVNSNATDNFINYNTDAPSIVPQKYKNKTNSVSSNVKINKLSNIIENFDCV